MCNPTIIWKVCPYSKKKFWQKLHIFILHIPSLKASWEFVTEAIWTDNTVITKSTLYRKICFCWHFSIFFWENKRNAFFWVRWKLIWDHKSFHNNSQKHYPCLTTSFTSVGQVPRRITTLNTPSFPSHWTIGVHPCSQVYIACEEV